MFFEWHPTVVHDLHESVALLITWNGTGPTNEDVDPVTYDERLEMSFHEVTTLTGFGMPGVWSWNFGDDFAHLFMDSIGLNHNALGRGYETFGNGTAETLVQTSPPDEVEPRVVPALAAAQPSPSAGRRATTSTTWRPRRSRRSTSRRSSPRRCSRISTETGFDSWRKGVEQPPFAFLIPHDQGDPARVAQLVSRLLAQGIEVQPLDGGHRRSRKAPSRPEPTWCGSISPTGTTRSIC